MRADGITIYSPSRYFAFATASKTQRATRFWLLASRIKGVVVDKLLVRVKACAIEASVLVRWDFTR